MFCEIHNTEMPLLNRGINCCHCTIWGNVTGQRLAELDSQLEDDCTIWGNVTGQRPRQVGPLVDADCTIWGNVTGQRPLPDTALQRFHCTIWGNVTGQRRGHGDLRNDKIVPSGEMLPVKDNEYTEDMGKLIVPSGEMLLTGIHLMPHVYPFATCGLLSSMAVPTLESSLNPLTRIFLVPNA